MCRRTLQPLRLGGGHFVVPVERDAAAAAAEPVCPYAFPVPVAHFAGGGQL